jgi:hypothetical protein
MLADERESRQTNEHSYQCSRYKGTSTMFLQNLLQKRAFKLLHIYVLFFFHILFLVKKTQQLESWYYFCLRVKKFVVHDHQMFSCYGWFLFLYLVVDLQYLQLIYPAVVPNIYNLYILPLISNIYK